MARARSSGVPGQYGLQYNKIDTTGLPTHSPKPLNSLSPWPLVRAEGLVFRTWPSRINERTTEPYWAQGIGYVPQPDDFSRASI